MAPVGRQRIERIRIGGRKLTSRDTLWILAGALAPIALALLAAARRASRARVRDVMVRGVVAIDASTPIIEAARRMRDANVGALPVVADGKPVGIVTDRDLVVRAMAQGAEPGSERVEDFATRNLVCARPDWTVDEAMEVMSECQIGRLPVVDSENRVIGMVTLSSLAL